MVMVAAVSPAMAAVAQDPKEEKAEAEAVEKNPKADPKAKEEEKKEAKKAEEGKKKEMMKTGGISPENAALLALGAGALLVGGGVLVRRAVGRQR